MFMTLASVGNAETNTIDNLYDGIAAFLCEDEDTKEFPLIFVRENDDWRLSGYEQNIVTKTDKGFMSKRDNSLTVLSKDTADVWKLETLDESGSKNTKCSSQDNFLKVLAFTISPKIIENSKTLAMDTYNARRDLENEKSKSQRLESDLKARKQDAIGFIEKITTLQRAFRSDKKLINDLKKKSDILEIKLADTVEKLEAQKRKTSGTGDSIFDKRFVISSEVLFSVGSSNLGSLGKTEVNKVAGFISDMARKIPEEVDWIINVDGHTDRIPFTGFGKDYKDNWELSQARALSVVRYLMDDLKIPANRLAANGFGEFQPIDNRDTPEAYKTNRRIEIRFSKK